MKMHIKNRAYNYIISPPSSSFTSS